MNDLKTDGIPNSITFKDITVSIQEIGEDYNNEMLMIMDRSPMQSRAIDFFTDKHPNIFTIPMFYYDSFKYYGFFVDDELHGFALLALKQTLVNGESQLTFHFTDFFLDHSLRRRNLYYLCGPYIYSQLPDDCKVGYGIFIKGNQPIKSIITKTATPMPFVPQTRVVANFKTFSIFLLFKKKVIKGYHIRKAEPADLAQIIQLLNQSHAERLFGKPVTESSFLEELERTPGLSLNNYYIALKGNEIHGACAVWDTNSFNKIKVTKYGFWFRIVRGVHAVLAKAFNFKALPNVGNHFLALYIRDMAIKSANPETMKALLVHIYNAFRSQPYHMISSSIEVGDPLEEAFSHFLNEVVESQLVLGVFPPVELDSIQTNNPFIETGIL